MISIKDLQVRYDSFELKSINLEISRNEFFVLMGPTGAGKTVLLESIAGITPVKSGTIIINGQDITTLPPEKRGVGIVYQDYALFPHMNVKDNITYAVRYHSMEKKLVVRRLAKLCEDLNIGHLLERYPATLSGGEQQRTALARAMMFEPAVLMFDEPLSALDPVFRLEIQDLLRRLHESTDITFLMVTHDFSEALTLANRAAVMNCGQIEQVDDVQHLFRKPSTEFVAGFVGMKNIIHVEFNETTAIGDGFKVQLARSVSEHRGSIAVRPEDIVLHATQPQAGTINSFEGIVMALLDRGFFFEVIIRSAGYDFTALVTKGSLASMNISTGRIIYFSFRKDAIHCL
jgi:molybdate/tungstate transport system ATP-binding protein